VELAAGDRALRDSSLAKGKAGRGAGWPVRTCKVVAMRLVSKWNHKGQSLIEYALIATVVSAAIVAMSTYVFRSVQATQQAIQEEFSRN